MSAYSAPRCECECECGAEWHAVEQQVHHGVPTTLTFPAHATFQQPAPRRVPQAPAAAALSVSSYAAELWTLALADAGSSVAAAAVAEAAAATIGDRRTEDDCIESEEDDEDAAACERGMQDSAAPPGSLHALLHSLYRLPPPAAAAMGCTRRIHLLPRHPNLLPIEEWSSNVCNGSDGIDQAASHTLRFVDAPLSLHTLLRFYQRTSLLACSGGGGGCGSLPLLSAGCILSPEQTRFMLFQLLHCLRWMHDTAGVSHGALTPANVRLTVHNGKMWLYLAGMQLVLPEQDAAASSSDAAPASALSSPASASSLSRRQRRHGHRSRSHRSRGSIPSSLSPLLPPADSLCFRWWKGELSNLHYLLALNALAGRSPGGGGLGSWSSAEFGSCSAAWDPFALGVSGGGDVSTDASFHPILPWVVDFASSDARAELLRAECQGLGQTWDGSWTARSIVFRDFSRSKFRLKKGDEQLDFQFRHSHPHRPYHVTECLSDITLAVYRARVTPLSVLRRIVRANFVAEEYPSSLSKLEAWTPDEAVPELFLCASSMRAGQEQKRNGMNDLSVPWWILPAEHDASPPVDPLDTFVSWHRSVLESAPVSQALHEWIDLTFGYKLSGSAAVQAKNVPLVYESSSQTQQQAGQAQSQGSESGSKSGPCVFALPRRPAFLQLFDRPHPPRRAMETNSAAAAPIRSASASSSTAAAAPAASPQSTRPAAQHSAPQLPSPEPFTPAAANGDGMPMVAPLSSSPIAFPSPRLPQPQQSSTGAHAGTAAPVPVPASLSDPAAALASLPHALHALHSLEYFRSFDHTLFEPIVGPASYAVPPRGLREWRGAKERSRVRQSERKARRRRRGGYSSTEESSSSSGSDQSSSDESDAFNRSKPAHDESSSAAVSLAERQANDMFQFGLLLAELFHPRPLFTPRSFHAFLSCNSESRALDAIVAPLPWGIGSVVRRCLALDWTLRPSARELIQSPVAGGLGLFDVLLPHPPHALSSVPVSNVLTTPYSTLWRWMRRWRRWVLRCPGGMEGLLRSSAAGVAGAGDDAASLPCTPAGSRGNHIASESVASASSKQHTTFSFATDSADRTEHVEGVSSLHHTNVSPAAALDSHSCCWSCASHSISHASSDAPSIADVLRWLLDHALPELYTSLYPVAPQVFLLVIPHVLDLAVSPSFVSEASNWPLLRAVMEGLARMLGPMWSRSHLLPFVARILLGSPPNGSSGSGNGSSAFLLDFVFTRETLRMARMRFAPGDLLRPLLRSLRTALLTSPLPAVAQRAHDLLLEFCLCELNLPASSLIGVSFLNTQSGLALPSASAGSGGGGGGVTLALGSGGSAGLVTQGDEELFLFDVLAPLVQRLATPAAVAAQSMSTLASSASSPNVSGRSLGGVAGSGANMMAVGVSASQSIDRVARFLSALLPELHVSSLAHVVLPNILWQLTLTASTPLALLGTMASARHSLVGSLSAERDRDARLCIGLDLLVAMLPELSLDQLHALLREDALVRALFLCMSPAPVSVSGSGVFVGGAQGISIRTLSAAAMRRVIFIVVFVCGELAAEKMDVGPTASQQGAQASSTAVSSKTSAAAAQAAAAAALQVLLAPTRASFFLPCVAEFLRTIVAKIDLATEAAAAAAESTTSPSSSIVAPSLVSSYTLAELHEFLHTVYVSLSSVVGRQQLRQSVPLADKVEELIQAHAKQQYLADRASTSAGAATAPAGTTVGADSPTTTSTFSVAAALQQAAPIAPDLNVLARARQHALQVKLQRSGWAAREATRDAGRQGGRDAQRQERALQSLLAGFSVGSDSGAPVSLPSPASSPHNVAPTATAAAPVFASPVPQRSMPRSALIGAGGNIGNIGEDVPEESGAGDGEDDANDGEIVSPPSPTLTPQLQSAIAALSTTSTPQPNKQQQQKRKGFFSSGIFARNNNSSNTVNAMPSTAAASTGRGSVSGGQGTNGEGTELQQILGSPAAVSSSSSGGYTSTPAGSPSSAHTPATPLGPGAAAAIATTSSSSWYALDFGDSILPSRVGGPSSLLLPLSPSGPHAASAAAAGAAAAAAAGRMDLSIRGLFRGHGGAITSLECHPDVGLVLSSSRAGEGAPTVKLWSLSSNQAGIRPVHDYSRKVQSSSSSSSASGSSGPRLPRHTVLQALLLVNPYEPLSRAFAYASADGSSGGNNGGSASGNNNSNSSSSSSSGMGGAQIHVLDIETLAPIFFRSVPASWESAVALTADLVRWSSHDVRGGGIGSDARTFAPAAALAANTNTKAEMAGSGSISVGGSLSCFAYSAPLHSLVVGTPSSGVRWMDLRSGGGFVSSAWQTGLGAALANAASGGGSGGGGGVGGSAGGSSGGSGAGNNHASGAGSSSGGPTLRCLAVEKPLSSSSAESGMGGACNSHLLYAGLSTGEVVVFDTRTGCVSQQWRAHEAPLLHLHAFPSPALGGGGGGAMLLVAGQDHAVTLWQLGGGGQPVLLQRFAGLEDNVRGVVLVPQAHGGGGGVQLMCTVGSRIGVAMLATGPPADVLPPMMGSHNRKPATASTLTMLPPLALPKGKNTLGALALLPAFDFVVAGADDGRIVVCGAGSGAQNK